MWKFSYVWENLIVTRTLPTYLNTPIYQKTSHMCGKASSKYWKIHMPTAGELHMLFTLGAFVE
jgi:hypothetical protein